jgi:predicted permease
MAATLWHDLRYGARLLLKNPGFSLVAIVSIAIGVGANAAMFSLADGLVLRPLPVPRPGDIVTVRDTTPDVGIRSSALSYPDYVDLREQARSFEGLVAYRFVITSFANRVGEPVQRKVGLAVSGNLFDAMRVTPALGRAFRADEDAVVGRDAVVVLDYDEWQQRFAADPGIIERRIRIGGVEFTVIGVAPAGFTGIDHDVHPAFYLPLAMFATVQDGTPADERTRRDTRTLIVKGRLKPGVPLAQARQDAQQIASALAQNYPNTNRNHGFEVRTQLEAFADGPGATDMRLVTMLMTLAVVVMLVACANVAGLLTSRAPVRAREIALRLAIGAGRGRLVRQLVTESLLIAVGGGGVGLAAGYGVIAIFQRLEFPTDIPLKLTFELDERAIMVGVAIAAVSTMLASLVPAWQGTRADLISAIKEATAASSRQSRSWGRHALVGGQVALSLVLLTTSVFFYRTFQTELNRGPGFRTDHLLMVPFDPSLAHYDGARTSEFYRLLKERTAAIPGVKSVALTSTVPMKADTLQGTAIAPEGFQFPPGAENVNIVTARVDEGYFDTIGIPIISGRGFQVTDTTTTSRVVVVNDVLAAHYWPGQSAIGKRVRLDGIDRSFAEIVGVAADAKYFFIAQAPAEFIYLPRMQHPVPQSVLLIESIGDAAPLSAGVRDAVRAIDPNMPVFGIRSMKDFYFSRAEHTSRLIVGTVAGMGAMGLALAMVGLYGLVAYRVSRRTREIGIRMAVGAAPGSVLRMVLRHGLLLAVGGIVAGAVASVAAGNLLHAVFPSNGGSDIVTYALVVPTLVAVTLLAAYIPARRAAHIDPLRALRQD